jgi:hypothetical protein
MSLSKQYNRIYATELQSVVNNLLSTATALQGAILDDVTFDSYIQLGRFAGEFVLVEKLFNTLEESMYEDIDFHSDYDAYPDYDELYDESIYDQPVGTPINFQSKKEKETEPAEVFYSTNTPDGTEYFDKATSQRCEYDASKQTWFCTDGEEYPDAK